MQENLLIHNIRQLVSCDAKRSVLSQAALVCEGDNIAWYGPQNALPDKWRGIANHIDATGLLLMPGLIDCHTHFLFAGNRSDEFSMRLQGKNYQEIAAQGGGILSTVRALRASTDGELKKSGRQRLDQYLTQGVTTIEGKSGYGLSLKDELRSLRLMRELAAEHPVEIVRTFLGAHAIPPEFADNRAGYIKCVTREMLPEVAGDRLAEFCDVFCDQGAFSVAESREVLQAGKQLGLKCKIHTDEFANLGGCGLAAELGAVSADHLCSMSCKDIQSLREAGTVGVALPGTNLTLRLKQSAPARAMLEAGVTLAIATDFNPGTNCCQNLWLTGTLACLTYGLTPAEVLHAMTYGAACAIARQQRLGSIELGKQADLILVAAQRLDDLFYAYGHQGGDSYGPLRAVIKSGRTVWSMLGAAPMK